MNISDFVYQVFQALSQKDPQLSEDWLFRCHIIPSSWAKEFDLCIVAASPQIADALWEEHSLILEAAQSAKLNQKIIIRGGMLIYELPARTRIIE